MRKVKAIILALRIEFHWWHIKHYRKKFDVLYDAGEALGSARVQELNKRTSKHAIAVMRCERYYTEHYSEVFQGVL